MSDLNVDLYFSFRSPWSYFGACQMFKLQEEYALNVEVHVVNPIFIRYNDFFDKAHEKWRPYFLTDLMRYSEYRGIPIGAPKPDPINTELAADDPGHLVRMLSPLGIAAQAAGKGIEFAKEVSTLVWNGQVEGWNEGDHLAQAAARAGLNLAELQAWVADSNNDWQGKLDSNDAALEVHHWGVPTMVFEGEPFFGQDKIELLLWRMEQKGLQKRS